jgi:hypothetical protein
MFLKWRDLAGSAKLKKTWFSLEMELLEGMVVLMNCANGRVSWYEEYKDTLHNQAITIRQKKQLLSHLPLSSHQSDSGNLHS